VPENHLATAGNSNVAAVVPVHNRADLLRRMLETATAQTLPFETIIVVDNASTDDAPAVAREFGCRVLSMGHNTGFARAVNTGWRSARAEWIAVLNSDVELHPDWLAHLTLGANQREASFATGLILNARNRASIDGTYDLVSRAACAWRAGYGDVAVAQTTTPIAIAPGTACLFRRGVLEQLNGYEESFESWLEDVDLGLRCVRRGFSGVFVPEAVAWHHCGATLGPWNPRMVRLISRNQLLLVSRHFDRALFRRYFWSIAVGQLLWGAVAARHGAFFAWLRGKVEGLRRFHFSASPSAQLESFLKASESEIRRRACDSYWRWYFRLTGQRSEAP
jgi:N-acetylglucosaminyl-diphospho-decaprenol L-rhamnosyltransferase